MEPDTHTEHNLANFLIKISHLLGPSGCRTVGELLASGALDELTPTAQALVGNLQSLDYVALRSLAAAVADPRIPLDDESLF